MWSHVENEVLNMLIGVLCEVVTATADDEQEKIMIQDIRNEITAVFEEIDINGDGTVPLAFLLSC